MCHLRASLKWGLPLRIFVAALTFLLGLTAGAVWRSLTKTPTTRVVTSATVSVTRSSDGRVIDYSRRFETAEVVSAGILDGRARSKPAPRYPSAGKSVRAQGTVVVSVRVDEGGRVEAAWGVSGHPLLQPSAVEAAREARFAPTFLGGRPVKVAGLLTYEFALD